MPTLKAILFDVDGVLLNSLGAHLRICRDLGQEYGLQLNVPDEEGLRRMARSGIKISPQRSFFLAVGFPEPYAECAEAHYRSYFSRDYAPQVYPGTHQMIAALSARGILLGIISANVLANFADALAPSMALFDSRCIFTADGVASLNKADAIRSALQIWQLPPTEAIFVGDQNADYDAAVFAGVPFIGTSYGWSIAGDDDRFPVADSVDELEALLSRVASGDSTEKL